MENTGSYLLSDIDYYYQLLVNYELEEAAYAQYLEEFDRIVEPYLRDCPPETKEKLNHLGFKRAMRELPAGDDARKYLGILIASESYLTRQPAAGGVLHGDSPHARQYPGACQ